MNIVFEFLCGCVGCGEGFLCVPRGCVFRIEMGSEQQYFVFVVLMNRYSVEFCGLGSVIVEV